MLSFGVFCSPATVGVLWQYIGKINTRINITSPLRLAIVRGWFGAMSMRPIWRRFARICVGDNPRYTLPSEAIAEVAAPPQLLPDDILYVIAGNHLEIYSNMLMVNKNLNHMLRQFDAWNAFVEVVEIKEVTRDIDDNGFTNEYVNMILRDAPDREIMDNFDNVVKIVYHGESVKIHTSKYHYAHAKIEERRNWRFGKLLSYERYDYDYCNITNKEIRWLSYKAIYTPKTSKTKHAYKVEYNYNRLGNIRTTLHTRDGKEYSPVEEFTETVAMVMTGGIMATFTGAIIYGNWCALCARFAVYKTDASAFVGDIAWILQKIFEPPARV